MRDDDLGGPPDESRADTYRILRIATWRWRLRLFSGITVGVLVMEGWGIALVFTAAIGIVAGAELASRRLARRDVARRTEQAR